MQPASAGLLCGQILPRLWVRRRRKLPGSALMLALFSRIYGCSNARGCGCNGCVCVSVKAWRRQLPPLQLLLSLCWLLVVLLLLW